MQEKIRKIVDKVLVLKPYLVFLTEGRIFKLVFAWFLRSATVLFSLWFLIEWFSMWKTVFEMSGSMVLVLAILMILSAAAVFGIINVILVKADAIVSLPETKDYIVIPIAVLFIKLVGELLILVSAFIGLAGFMLSLTNEGKMFFKMLPFFSGSGIEAGLIGLVSALGFGFLTFFLSYFFAEQVGVFADIARNTKK